MAGFVVAGSQAPGGMSHTYPCSMPGTLLRLPRQVSATPLPDRPQSEWIPPMSTNASEPPERVSPLDAIGNAGVLPWWSSTTPPVLPGTVTPSEMLRARSYGRRTVKFFPAERAGGLAFLDSVVPAVNDLRFVPTGGIGPLSAGRYLEKPSVAAVGGSWMVSRELLAAGAWEDIGRLCGQAAAVAAAHRSGQTS